MNDNCFTAGLGYLNQTKLINYKENLIIFQSVNG